MSITAPVCGNVRAPYWSNRKGNVLILYVKLLILVTASDWRNLIEEKSLREAQEKQKREEQDVSKRQDVNNIGKDLAIVVGLEMVHWRTSAWHPESI